MDKLCESLPDMQLNIILSFNIVIVFTINVVLIHVDSEVFKTMSLKLNNVVIFCSVYFSSNTFS